MSAPLPISVVYTRLTEATRRYFDAEVSYVQRYDDSGELERLDSALARAEGGGELAGGFRLSDGTLLVRRDAAALLDRFLAGEFSSGDVTRHQWEIRQLRAVREVFQSLIHENIHALGPRGSVEMRAEWETARYPHVPVFSEGLAEFAARRSGGDILRAAGLTDIDPRIAVVGPPTEDVAFPGATNAVVEFVRVVNELTGSTMAAELAAMIRDGGAKRAIDNSVRRVMEAQGMGALRMGQGLNAYLALSREVENAFVGVAQMPSAERSPQLRRQFARQRMIQMRREMVATISEFRDGPAPGARGIAV